MKNKNKWKLLLDAAMVVVFSLLYSKSVISLDFHEITGLIILAVALIHVAFNYRWVVGMTKKLFSPKLPGRTRVLYLVDFLLVVAVVLMIISSLLISKKVQLFGIGGHTAFWIPFHFFIAALMLLLIGVHLGLHFSYIKQTLMGNNTPLKVVTILVLVLFAVCFVFGVYTLATSSFGRWLSAPFSSMEESHGAGPGQGLGQGAGGGKGMGGHAPEPFSMTRLLLVFCLYFSIMMASAVVTAAVASLLGKRRSKKLKGVSRT